MKKRYLMLIPVVALILVCAAAIGYIQLHPEKAPEGTEFLVFTEEKTEEKTEQTEGSGSAEKEEAPELTPAQQRALELTKGMTLEEKIYQMMFVTPEVLTNSRQGVVRAGDATKAAVAETPVGGVLYSRQNMKSAAQLTEMLTNLQAYASADGTGIPMFTGATERGGDYNAVSRAMGKQAVQGQSAYGKENDPEKVKEMGQTIAETMLGAGLNVNFAPNANISDAADAFSSDPAIAAELAASEVSGMHEFGLAAVVSEFPGAGSMEGDPENGKAASAQSEEDFRANDLLPFEKCIAADAAFIQVSNMTAEAFDSVPCSLSAKVMTELLRDEMGYEGVIITGKLSDAAITGEYSTGEAAVQAVQAGADMLLCPGSITEAFDAIKAAVEDGTITEDQIDLSVMRILAVKAAYGLVE